MAILEIWFEKRTKESVVGTVKNIRTVVVHCWYIKDAFAWNCRKKIFEKQNILEGILMAGCFRLNSEFILKSSSLSRDVKVSCIISRDVKVSRKTNSWNLAK